jgi:hypothetical protein
MALGRCGLSIGSAVYASQSLNYSVSHVLSFSSHVTDLRMPNKWHICKEGQGGNKKKTTPQLAFFSELPSFTWAGSRSGCFHTSLGCKPRPLIRVSLGWFDYTKIWGRAIQLRLIRKSQVSDRRRLTALVEVHWAPKVQATHSLPHTLK